MSDDPMMPIGYRSYRVSQLVDPQVVKRLRDLDVPLRAVAEIVRARDPEVSRSVIADHEQMMREHLVDLARLVDELQAAITQPALQTPAHVRREPDQHVVAISELGRRSGARQLRCISRQCVPASVGCRPAARSHPDRPVGGHVSARGRR